MTLLPNSHFCRTLLTAQKQDGEAEEMKEDPDIDAEDCFERCHDDPLCKQAVFEESGPWGKGCWLGTNEMPVALDSLSDPRPRSASAPGKSTPAGGRTCRR